VPYASRIRKSKIFRFISVGCLLAVTHSAHAFFIESSPQPVSEFYNLSTGHYFLTGFSDEISAIQAGAAGPGWVLTGHTFLTHSLPANGCSGSCGEPVSRFYAPGPNSHFFTIDAVEAAALKQPGSGWIFEGYGFKAERPDAAGGCAAGLTPVVRLYNNRFAFNDSNHRFVTGQDERARMVAKGWIDEGVKICAYGAQDDAPIRTFAFLPALDHGKIQPSSVCEDESRNLGACMAVNNLPAPTTYVASAPGPVYGSYSGLNASTFITEPVPDEIAASRVFVQQAYNFYGIHVDTAQRGAAIWSSVNPLYQFKTSVEPGAFDARVFPFSHNYETDAQISVKFIANVRRVNVRNSASQAYGHPTLEFIDQRSGHHVYFTTLVYGTINGGDFVGPDLATGKVIVATTFRGDSPYVRNLASWTFSTPSGFTPENPWGRGGPFEYRMDRTEFARVLAAARGGDPGLSAAPEDYLLDNFHFNNEVYGDGEIGMNLGGFRLELIRR
jgi:hypothetical protein